MSDITSFHRELARGILSFPRDESQPSESHVLVIADILAKRFPDLNNRYARCHNYKLENLVEVPCVDTAAEMQLARSAYKESLLREAILANEIEKLRSLLTRIQDYYRDENFDHPVNPVGEKLYADIDLILGKYPL